MSALERMRIDWTGFKGGPGVSTLYFADAAAAQDDVRTFFVSVAASVPNDVILQEESFGDVIDDTNGVISGTWVGANSLPKTGEGIGVYAAPVGFCIEWLTAAIVGRRRLRGRTYLVPQMPTVFDTDGSLLPASQNAFITDAQTLVAAQGANMRVWSRPQAATPAWTDKHGKVHPARAARAGSSAAVIGARVPDKAVVLRSRRD